MVDSLDETRDQPWVAQTASLMAASMVVLKAEKMASMRAAWRASHLGGRLELTWARGRAARWEMMTVESTGTELGEQRDLWLAFQSEREWMEPSWAVTRDALMAEKWVEWSALMLAALRVQRKASSLAGLMATTTADLLVKMWA